MKKLLLAAFLALATLSAQAVNLASTYTQNFNAMGTAGTTAPTDWTVYSFAGASGDWTAATGVTGISGGVANATLIASTTTTVSSATQGYNFALSTGTADRALGTSPTSNKGIALQLTLTNTSGASLSSIQLGYDIRRFTAASTANTLVGYWLFYSLDGGATWTNVAALNPTISGTTGVVVPNTTGTTVVPSTLINFSSAVANNGTILLRWVDDNASESSPDQLLGLDNVTVTTISTSNPATALSFDGINDYVTMGTAPALNAGGPPSNGFTLECWFRKEGTGVTSSSGNGGVVCVPLFGKGRGEAENSNVDCDYFFGINASGQLVADFEAYPAAGITAGQNYPVVATNAAIVNNQWYHAAATYDGPTSTWKLYLDGVQVGTATTAANALPRYDSIQHFGIGAAFTSTGVPEGAFAGRIDEVRVWNYVRTQAQIASAKDTEITSATGLIGRYGMNEASGTSIANSPDVSGAPVGVLTNGPFFVDGAPFVTNIAPTVSLTAPTSGSTVIAGSTVTLSATAADSDGTISKVEFYQDTVLLNSDATAPYSYVWTTPAAGTYTLTAKAYDNSSGVTTSSPVTLNVIVNQAPTVALTAPADNTSLTAPATVDLTASASDSDGSVAKVEFYQDSVKIGETLSSPYTFTSGSLGAGDYVFTAKAIDDLGLISTSTAATVHVSAPASVPPVVSLTSPSNNASFVAPATINLTASASDVDGTVAKVEFFNGATKLGEDTTDPYTYSWSAVAPGDYSLTAKATDDQTATTTSSVVSIHVVANQPPVVTAASPEDEATGLSSSTTLSVNIADPEGDSQTVTFYGRKTTAVTPGADFSFIAIPDTQFYSENANHNGGATAAIYNAQTQWIADNRPSKNIAFVSHMGDIVQNGDKGGDPAEWINADTAMKIIEDRNSTFLAYGIPWGGAPGNHDYGPSGGGSGTTTFYNQYFGTSRYLGRNYYGGNFGTNNNNNYELFSASGLDFIIIHLEYNAGTLASYQPVLDWADALLKAYPNRRAILTSHYIVNTGNPATFSTQGQSIYNELKDNPNLFLMLCGHVNGEGRRTDTYNGHTVTSILQDYQDITNGGNGFLRVYNFSPANNLITVSSYSPTLNRAVQASDAVPAWTAAYNLTYDLQSAITDWIPLGTVNVPAGGTSAQLAWTGLEAGSRYEWYASADDGTNSGSSAPRHFSTAAAIAPIVSLTAPANNATYTQADTIDLNADASDADGTIARVEFYAGNTKLATDTTSPYTYTWTGAAAGTYTLTAVAVDNSNLATLSSAVTVTVTNAPPVVAITAPEDDATYDAPATYTITADASDPDGTISKVEFFAGATKLGEDLTAPYALTIANAYTGLYFITATATITPARRPTPAPSKYSSPIRITLHQLLH